MRELENIIERAMILARGEPLRFDGLGSPLPERTGESAPAAAGKPLELDALIKRHIQHVLGLTGGQDTRPRRGG